MALPSSGPLTMAQINAEFGRGNNLNSYRGTTYYTSSAGPFTFPTGAISFSNFYGTQLASPTFSFSIVSNQDRANLRSLAVAAGWNQSVPVIATLNAGVYIYSTVDGTAALTIDGSWPGGVTLVNNGFIMGQGGQGGGFYARTPSGGGAVVNTDNYLQSAGSNAINLGVSCTIQNNSYIGGGGGGGGSIRLSFFTTGAGAGGGAGGGVGGETRVRNENVSPVTDYSSPGGAGGSPGSNGANGVTNTNAYPPGGGGGRVMPGTNTVLSFTNNTPVTATSTGGGANNAGAATSQTPVGTSTAVSGGGSPGLGGSGGGTGYAYSGTGAVYANYCYAAGGGGGYGASGGNGSNATQPAQAFTGAAGGKCANLNGFTITWSATGTRYGAIS